jgi:hypothetical protein
MSQRIYPNSGDEIEIPAALGIVYMAALAARDDERVSGIILQEVLAFQVHHGLSGAIYGRGKGARHSIIIAICILADHPAVRPRRPPYNPKIARFNLRPYEWRPRGPYNPSKYSGRAK